MIKKLRRRFVLVNMIVVGSVLFVLFVLLTLTTIQSFRMASYGYLDERARKEPTPKINVLFKRMEGRRILPGDTFFVTIDKNGSRTYEIDSQIDISVETMDSMTDFALASDSNVGTDRNLGIRYRRVETEEGLKIGFVDTSHELALISRQILINFIYFVGIMVLFFPISLLLSRMVVKPAKLAFNNQQQFISDASHELKTPLTVILANADMVLKRDDAALNRQSIEYIDKEAKKMAILVKDLLFLARLDEQNKTMVLEKTNLNDLLLETTLPFESVAFEADMTIDVSIEKPLAINGDSSQLKRLIGILLDNACKYSQKDSAITVSLKQVGNKAELTMHNLGETIPDKELNKVFDRFYRVDKAREQTLNSNGLGLAIAKRIANTHSGKISCSSDDKTGTTFTVQLPLI